ncbi:MAG: TadE/TadG family type IV pilus assembly protein [Ilumatobacteraceae bacterium]
MRRTARPDGGQAVVEFALALPLVCTMLLGVVQVGVVVRHQLAVHVAARAAARAAAVSADAAAAARAAAGDAVRLQPLAVDVSIGRLPTGGLISTVRVDVRYTDLTDVPIIGVLVPPVVLHADVTMTIEPP